MYCKGQEKGSHLITSTTSNRRKIKVYKLVVKELSLKFETTLDIFINGLAKNSELPLKNT
ncbi:hypothetical protein CGI83_07250 [Vibrio parahaemolyticus]|nr:hypothetical protein CGJ28_19000 [Vibrio parahaemolyticus]TOH30652.1 hypothetical protein CGI83_07250 [Vibrio parahaemolyticus]TOJ16829.1 hypothetical protein CGI45_10360 [Vibrio parahaemolyticus]